MPGKCLFFRFVFYLFSIVNLYSYNNNNNNNKLMIKGITIPLNISKLWHMHAKSVYPASVTGRHSKSKILHSFCKILL